MHIRKRAPIYLTGNKDVSSDSQTIEGTIQSRNNPLPQQGHDRSFIRETLK